MQIVRPNWPLLCRWVDVVVFYFIQHASTMNAPTLQNVIMTLGMILRSLTAFTNELMTEDTVIPVLRLWLAIPKSPIMLGAVATSLAKGFFSKLQACMDELLSSIESGK